MGRVCVLTVLAVLLAAGTGWAVEPDIKCESDKIKTAGKYAKCLLAAESKAVKKGVAQAEKIAKCDLKYNKKWDKIDAKAEAKGPPFCPTSGDKARVQARVIRDADEMAASVTGFKRVFVSSTAYSANLGGLAGADEKCQALADAASLGGNYKAWLSDNASSPSTTFVQATVPYILVDGTPIADDWADLTDGELANLLNKTEWGGSPPRELAAVWTDTTGAGGAVSGSLDCSGWTSDASAMATVGLWTIPVGWSLFTSFFDCDEGAFPIYCFEQ